MKRPTFGNFPSPRECLEAVGLFFDRDWDFVFVQCCLALFYALIVLYLVCKEIRKRR